MSPSVCSTTYVLATGITYPALVSGRWSWRPLPRPAKSINRDSPASQRLDASCSLPEIEIAT